MREYVGVGWGGVGWGGVGEAHHMHFKNINILTNWRPGGG